MGIYHAGKRLAGRILSRKFLYRHEHAFRWFQYFWRAGNRFRCNLCGSGLRCFISLGDDRICPRCGSIARVRRLYQLLESEFLSPSLRILDFSPSRSLYRKLRKGGFRYTASDLSGDFLADEQYDITSIEVPDHSFDLVICYHVLEHVEEDERAMKELRRVLRPGGHCLIQTPFREGATYENPAVNTPGERLRHFGQEDHVRVYAVQDLRNRLEAAGFKVDIRTFHETQRNRAGLKEQETVLVCS